MKTIGLIGGTSWVSTQDYYRLINEGVKEKLGGLHSAKLVLYSVDFEEVINFEISEEWEKVAEIIIDAAQRVEKSGADFVLICTNTLHKLADRVQGNINIPILDLREVTAKTVKSKGLGTVGLLGLKPTMEEDFYKIKLQNHGIDVVVPDKEDRNYVHDTILNELCMGIIKNESKERFRAIIDKLVENGAEGMVLACTEIPMLVKQSDYKIPIFDTLIIHAESAVDYSLKK